MWYSDNIEELDYNKPIYVEEKGNTCLLIPQHAEKSYEIIGYDWFNLTAGRYCSCFTFKTVQEALDIFKEDDVIITNKNIE